MQTCSVGWPLVGRERELGAVGDLLAEAGAGGVVVAGEPGVGKTRLARELARVAESRGHAVAWVRATGSSAAIPLGAFAPLLPPATGDEGAALLAGARRALAGRGAGRRLVLCVDDGQLLDDASATLTHQLVAAGEAFAIVTVRRGEAVPDAVRALWKDELCRLVELAELAPRQVEELLTAALGGPVDGRTFAALWDMSRGNALFLRELVLYGREQGLLTGHDGIWRWEGDVAAGLRLAELVGTRLDTLAAAERDVLALVAVAAPLEVGILAPRELAPLGALERHTLVERRLDGRRRTADVAHPLHGEVVRAQLSQTAAERLVRRLADAVDAHGARRGSDLLRVAQWRLEAGDPGHGPLFERAAWTALGAFDFPLGERFARAAVDAGGGLEAGLMLGRSLAGQGRAREAGAVYAALAGEAEGDERRVADVAIAGARDVFWALDRSGEAFAMLDRALGQVTDPGLREELTAVRVRLLSASGRPAEALAAAGSIALNPEADVRARLYAALAACEAMLLRGHIAAGLELTGRFLPLARDHRRELPIVEAVLEGHRAFSLLFAGRPEEATAQAERTYAAAVGRRSANTTAMEAGTLGYVWLARGQVATALRFFREAVALLTGGDAMGMLPWSLAGLAQASALAGDTTAAADATARMRGLPLGHRAFATELDLADAWTAAAAGALPRAAAHARAGADRAREHGQDTYVLIALHAAARLGDAPSAAALAHAARRVDGPYAAAAAAHGAALGARDPHALSDAAERLAALGLLISAAEAAHAAAALHRDAGRDSSARTAAARSAAWLERCEGAHPPLLCGAPARDELTPREREIALLAAAGLTSREIADRLVVSVRTVDNHLQRVYRKLGVRRRQELNDVLLGG